MDKNTKRGRPAKNLIADRPFSIALSRILRERGEPNLAIEMRGKLSSGTLKNVLRSGNPTIETVWAIEDALGMPRGSLAALNTVDATKPIATEDDFSIADIPSPNAVRRKGDQDSAHQVLHLKTVGTAAALEKGASHRGGFDDENLYWDSVEAIPESTHLVKVRGNSMEPLMMHGQSVMVGTQYRTEFGEVPRNREIVIAEVTIQDNDIGGPDSEWEGVHCKRIQDGGDVWVFTSINPVGDTFSVAKENCKLWHVIGVYFGEKSSIPIED